ncbi:hypothetical protein DOK67_0002046 [Enterococcus sp. DIV0212c]|uniref:putative mucin/carbohydrate-binding domain-containing protein n=1 Tax=Enterococcus sp. DIV0212c TaxID=2230867 RepID=UPI001A9BE3FA|nr:putative mucin/carbohydrate-binding domain-containing protein [Enterococcus sp. DIV0212c]MBO1354776.1 WxL domain-containing protein [Enterococcus sp. DIV0212c]
MKKNIMIVLSVVIVFFLCGQVAQAEEGSLEITSMKEPTWLFKAGISKGRYHDRQDLGFILKKNVVLKVRQVNPEFKDSLRIRLLSNDSKEETTTTFGSEWVSISSGFETTPFINRAYGQKTAKIEYQIEDSGGTVPLPIYEGNGNENEFFTAWDKSDSSFALLKGSNFQLFIPKRDKALVKAHKNFKTLKDVANYLDDILNNYDQYIGLDNSSPVNMRSENRYFLKADVSGPGGAYYGVDWTANTSRSIDMWLEYKGWGTLHEIGHGYQAGFDNEGIYTGEVSNNLLAARYQYEKFGKSADSFSWLFNFGKRTEIDSGLYNKIIIGGKGYKDDLSHRERLVLLVMLQQKAGKEAYTKMYQGYRLLAQQSGFNTKNYPLPELMNKYYSETSGFDFTPALDRWKMGTNKKQTELNRSRRYQAVAALADVVPSNQLDAARKSIDSQILINSNFEIIHNQQLAPLGLRGSLTIDLKIDDINKIKGKKIRLLDGKDVVSETVIDQEQVYFDDIPNGIYTLEVVDNLKLGYTFDQHYIYVKEKKNTSTLTFKKISASTLVNQEILFQGLGNYLVASFKTNANLQQASFKVINKDPHSYYEGEKYISIQVRDTTGKVIYSKELEGTKNTVGEDTFSFAPGYQLEIFHAETKTRLLSTDNIIYKGNNTNKFKMTVTGLANEQLKNNPELILKGKIDALAAEINSQEELKKSSESELKQQLWAAINELTEPNKTTYVEKYESLFANISKGRITVEVTASNEFLINAVSPFSFDQIELGSTGQATLENDQTLGLEVTDRRGTGGGWNVEVAMTDFSATSGEQEKTIVKGWSLRIPEGKITSDQGDLDNLPKAHEVIMTTANTNQLVFSADKNKGLGNYTNVWMDAQTAPEDAVSLMIPAYAKIGRYSAELTWSLIDGPIK